MTTNAEKPSWIENTLEKGIQMLNQDKVKKKLH